MTEKLSILNIFAVNIRKTPNNLKLWRFLSAKLLIFLEILCIIYGIGGVINDFTIRLC